MQQQQQQQQLQASFYQLHYLHQQQMKTMMRQGTNSNRSSISYPISPSSSTSSLHSKSSSLGRKIKQVFGKAKNTERGPKEIIIPDSPNSSVSSRKSRYFRNSIALPPSPASSTISSKVSFSSAITLHETYSASEYDRTGDDNTTCQKLTPDMAVKIKEELNSYKLNDMPVHPQSRQFTHFFV
ncbi:hypothetical protein G6F56_011578 [Rhizopus delemar]|nr:hypothetical protein G6F56_011578 [Rhizopus delemar]